MDKKTLPIDCRLAEIRELVLSKPITIIEAPPGTGKTTRVAPCLLSCLSATQRLYLLQPRRLAARSVAERIASEHGTNTGDLIGYQVRFDARVSRQTQLIVATEGILVRRLQEDSTISDTAIVVLDEFHERSLDADLLLGMLRRVQTTLRDDLKIVIMSATLDSEMIQQKLGDAPVVKIEAASFPVRIEYRPAAPKVRLVDHMVQTLDEVAVKHEGDILAFLPGAGEIYRAKEMLSYSNALRSLDVVPLHGTLSLEQQSAAIEPRARRRIVLSTNIAETSLTIEGVRVVVDSGVARVMRFAPEVGLDRLALENICSASARQRTGRAGRVAPGSCYRLWSEASDRSRAQFLEPEIRRVDLVTAVLQLYAWGEGDSSDFPWLEPPREDAWLRAKSLLEMLGAVQHGRITELGKRMSALPAHPRLARLMLEAQLNSCAKEACLLAAIISERDPFDSSSAVGTREGKMVTSHRRRWDSDCVERLHAIQKGLDGTLHSAEFGRIHRSSLQSIARLAQQFESSLPSQPLMTGEISKALIHSDLPPEQSLMRTLLSGFPDRLARRRNAGQPNGVMVGGKGVTLVPQSGVTEPELFLCVDVESRGSGDAIVRQASRVDLAWLPAEQISDREELFFHPGQKQVVARRRTAWFDLVLSETPTSITDEVRCAEILYEAMVRHWDQVFPRDDEVLLSFVARTNCLRGWLPELELPVIDKDLLQSVGRDLCKGNRSFAELKSAAWLDWLRSRLTQEQCQAIDREAPARIQLPSGSWAKIQYEEGKPPVLAVKIQEMFSVKSTPRIAKGRVPLLLHLLAPNMRPQQVTDDLSSFWANGYPIVKKELKRRYPKHSWPEDPTTAQPGRK